jgi:hypothetical protein
MIFWHLPLTNLHVELCYGQFNAYLKRRIYFFKKEIIMVEVTKSATEQIAEYFKGKEVSPVRIFLNAGG